MPKISRFEDLVAWQLSMDLADLIDAMVSKEPASRNLDFCGQIQRASAKAAPQIAEGFLRYRAKESAYYYRIARGSLGETLTHLMRGYRRGYWSENEYNHARRVAQGALDTTSGLLNSRLARIRQEDAQQRRGGRPHPRKA